MKGALIILAVTVATGFILYVVQKIFPRKSDDVTTDNGTDSRPEGCCGQHIVCEKDSLLAAVSTEIEYYEDEEQIIKNDAKSVLEEILSDLN